jgi:hypothetical protein
MSVSYYSDFILGPEYTKKGTQRAGTFIPVGEITVAKYTEEDLKKARAESYSSGLRDGRESVRYLSTMYGDYSSTESHIRRSLKNIGLMALTRMSRNE